MNNLDNFTFETSPDIEKDYDGPMTWVMEGDKLILKKGCIYEQNENKHEKKDPIRLGMYIDRIIYLCIFKWKYEQILAQFKSQFKEYELDEDLIIKLIEIFKKHYSSLCDGKEYCNIIADEWCELLNDIQFTNVLKALNDIDVRSRLSGGILLEENEHSENKREKKDPIRLRAHLPLFSFDVNKVTRKNVLDLFYEYGIDEALVDQLGLSYIKNYSKVDCWTIMVVEWCDLLNDEQYDNVLKALRELSIIRWHPFRYEE